MPSLGRSRVSSSPELRVMDPPSMPSEPSHERPPSGSGEATSAAWSLRWLGVVALLGLVFGRAVAPALWGARSGLERVIAAADGVAAVLTQFLGIAGGLLLVRLVVIVLRHPELPVWFRIAQAGLTATVLTIVLGAARLGLPPDLTLLMAITAAFAALLAVPITLRPAPTRVAGFVLAVQGAAALLQLSARFVAAFASEHAMPALYEIARHLATVVLALDLVAVVLVLLWLLRDKPRRLAVTTLSLLAVSAILSWAALRGSHYGAAFWQVIVGRTLLELCRHPLPLLATSLRYAFETFTLLAIVVSLVSSRSPAGVRVALSLALVSRASTDVPALALCLALAALVAAVSAGDSLRERGSPLPDVRPRNEPGVS